MQLSTTEAEINNDRIKSLNNKVKQGPYSICPERALLWTEYCKKKENRKKRPYIKMAEALSYVLLKKKITIYEEELIVGNYTSKRVGGSIYPELHGIPVLLDLFKFKNRETNPLQITPIKCRK